MNISPAEIDQLAKSEPTLRGMLKRLLAKNYDDFLSILYDDIQHIAYELGRNKHQLPENESEDATTVRIRMQLDSLGYECNAVSSGGNVDVEVAKNGNRWIAEAKKFTDVGDLRAGYLQLSTRYTPHLRPDGVAHGGILAYLRRPNAARAMKSWKEELETIDTITPPGYTFTDCSRMGPLAFNSEHLHYTYGTPFKVWHVCFVLHHEPLDASGLATAARRAKPKSAKSPSKPDVKATRKSRAKLSKP